MRHFEESIVIDRPMDEVVAFASDWYNAPRDGGVLAFRQTSPGPPGVGTTLEGRMVILGFERLRTKRAQKNFKRLIETQPRQEA